MNKSTNRLTSILDSLTQAARAMGINDTEWARRAGLRKETLSRLRHRPSCDFATLDALAEVVSAKMSITSLRSTKSSADNHFPTDLDREYEEQLLQLCASETQDAQRWAALGPRFFMAGLAVMLASVPSFNRRTFLTLAEQLHPGVSEPAAFAQWLKRSPVRPSRFLPMLAMEMKHAT